MHGKKKIKDISILPVSIFDFDFCNRNGLFLKRWMKLLGCDKICNLIEEVFGELIDEFFMNLKMEENSKWISNILGKDLTFTRDDLIKCFDMNKVNDDPDIIGLSRQELFVRPNDGLEIDLKRDMLVIDFPLQI